MKYEKILSSLIYSSLIYKFAIEKNIENYRKFNPYTPEKF